MRDDDLDPRPALTARPVAAPDVLGEDLSRHSLAELEARLGRLKAEIGRVEAAMASKRGVADAANALFKL